MLKDNVEEYNQYGKILCPRIKYVMKLIYPISLYYI